MTDDAERLATLDAEIAVFAAETERRRLHAAETGTTIVTVADACAALRSFFDKHPKQRAFWTSTAKRKATRKTRRAGATSGGVREWLARCLENPGSRFTYCGSTRGEARDRAWRNDTASGFVDVLARYGAPVERTGVATYELGGRRVEVRDVDLALDFDNGSRIELFGADTIRAIQKKRGGAKDGFWIDEAQDFRFLEQFYKAVVLGALTDFDGDVWMSGTPGRDCFGMFYEITRDDLDGPALPGWEVHAFSIVDNPFFGRVEPDGDAFAVIDHLGVRHGPVETNEEAERLAARVRWEGTAGKHIRENSLSENDPDVQREWFARWVKEATRHVYAVHEAPPPLEYAPLRTSDAWLRYATVVAGGNSPYVRAALADGWYDHERSVADLPRLKKRASWLFGIGLDFGHDPAAFAMVIDAFTASSSERWEMWSWKRVGLVPEDWRVIVEIAFRQLEGGCAALVGDPAGVKGELAAWRERLSIPIADADKANKEVWIASYNGDLRRGLYHYREKSPLLHEHRNLVWLPTLPGQRRKEHAHRQLVDGSVPSNHCADGALYLARALATHFHREPLPKEGAVVRQEREAEAEAERRTRERLEEDDGWDPVKW